MNADSQDPLLISSCKIISKKSRSPYEHFDTFWRSVAQFFEFWQAKQSKIGTYLGTYNSMTTYCLKVFKGKVGYLEKATKQSETSQILINLSDLLFAN